MISEKAKTGTASAYTNAQDQARIQQQDAELIKLRNEIKIMNDKMDLSGVTKKVDSNIELAREQYKQDELRKQEKEREK